MRFDTEKRRTRRRRPSELAPRVWALGLLAGVLLSAGTAAAQRSDPVIAARADMNSSLRQGIELAERAMTIVQSTSDPDELRRAAKMGEQGYLQWNRARGSLTVVQARSKFPEPLLDHALKIIDQARQALAQANSHAGQIAAFGEGQRAELTARALGYYTEALRHARRAAEFTSI